MQFTLKANKWPMSVYKRFNGKAVKHGDKNYSRATWYVRKRVNGRLIHEAIAHGISQEDAERYTAGIIVRGP